MISIREAEDTNDMCQSCRGHENVIRIMFECRYESNTQGVAIALCDNCRKELAEKLKEGVER